MRLYYTDTGKGPPVVLIHGLAGSTRYWEKLLPYLADRRVIAMDLLGFGRSPKPKSSHYTTEEHLDSIVETLDAAGLTTSAVIVGHSMGALLALSLAAHYPERVSKLVLIGLPLYKSAAAAKQAITKGRLSLRLAYYGPTSSLLCHIWCLGLRPLTRQIAPLYLRELPKAAAQDSLLHTWRAYSLSLHNIIEHQQVRTDLAKVAVPVLCLYGNREPISNQSGLTELSKVASHLKVVVTPGGHQLPVEQPHLVASYI